MIKTALVTGATGAIGNAVVEAFLKKDYAVCAVYNSSKKKADEMSEEYRDKNFFLLYADVADHLSVEKLYDNAERLLGKIGVSVHCAGIENSTLLPMMAFEEWEKVISVNLTGIYNCCKYAAKKMIPNKFGRIINVSSASASISFPGQAAYSASKAGVNALTKTLAKEMARFGVTVNAVAPGFVKSPMASVYYEKNIKHVPVGRFAEPKEVAEIIGFLASGGAEYITGSVYGVDGGLGI